MKTYGPDYEGQRHLPIWNECVWSHLLETYRAVFVQEGLAADPRLRLVYVPVSSPPQAWDSRVVHQFLGTIQIYIRF